MSSLLKPAFILPALSPLLIVLCVQAQTENKSAVWLRYTVKGEEFSATLPSEPAMKTSETLNARHVSM